MEVPSAPVRILVTQTAAPPLRELMSRAGLRGQYEFVHPQDGQPAPAARIALVSRDVTGASTKHDLEPSTAAFYQVLREVPGLEWVHIHSAGVDRPIFLELAERGVTITNSAGHNARVVAHTAVGALLALARHLPTLMAAQRESRWIPPSAQIAPRDLEDQVAVIVGWGAIGQHIASLLRVIGMRVRVARHDASVPASGAEKTVAYRDVAGELDDADWLVLACPLSDATARLIDRDTLGRLPAHAHLVNVSRGTVVDETALIDALNNGRLAGAYLDVFEHEPLAVESPLWRMPNVIATPHSAGTSAGNYMRVLQVFVDRLRTWEQREMAVMG